MEEMLRPVWDTVRMRGLRSPLGGGIRGLRKPWIWRQKGGIVRDHAETTGVNGGAGPGKMDRDGREGPGQSRRPAIWAPGQGEELIRRRKGWKGGVGALSQRADGHRVRTEAFLPALLT